MPTPLSKRSSGGAPGAGAPGAAGGPASLAPDQSPGAVTLEGISRSFGDVVALDELTVEIEAGELIALLGPSGCGKTTALRILGGFELPDRGRVLLDGQEITGLPPNKRNMGMVFQAYSLFPNMDLRDNVAFGLRMRKVDAGKRKARALELLELVGLTDAAARYPHQLSGGQQQRVALARALAVQPRVLLLDEPLSALDAQVRSQLRTEIRRLQRELGITTLFVTHDQSEALSIADRVGVMQAGRIEQLASPREIYREPATPFVAEFVGSINRLRGRLDAGGEVQVFGQRLQALNPAALSSDRDVDVLLRPEALDAVPDEQGSAQVEEQTFLGSAVRLRLRVPDGDLLVDVPSHRSGLEPGNRATVSVVTDRALVAEPGARSAAISGTTAASGAEPVSDAPSRA
jgi:putative spermidine/putrescine transport system ATP-binding protein